MENVQKMMLVPATRPNAGIVKMTELDKEMSQILKNTKLSTSEKMRLYQQILMRNLEIEKKIRSSSIDDLRPNEKTIFDDLKKTSKLAESESDFSTYSEHDELNERIENMSDLKHEEVVKKENVNKEIVKLVENVVARALNDITMRDEDEEDVKNSLENQKQIEDWVTYPTKQSPKVPRKRKQTSRYTPYHSEKKIKKKN